MTSMHCITVTVWIKGSRIFLTSFPFIFCRNHEEVETTVVFFLFVFFSCKVCNNLQVESYTFMMFGGWTSQLKNSFNIIFYLCSDKHKCS